MNRLIYGYRFLKTDDGDGGGAGGGAAADAGAADAGAADAGAADAGAADAGAADAGAADPDGDVNLREGAKKEEDADAGEKDAEVDEAAVKALVEAIAPVDMGLGKDAEGKFIGWDAEAVEHMAPVFARMGLDAEKAGKLSAAYAGLVKERNAAGVVAEKKANSQLVAAAKAEFGNDLDVRLKEADIGGEALYGKEFYAELRAIKVFANNPAAIAAHAAYGRKVADDPGAGGDGVSSAEKDLASRMYPGV